MAKVPHAKEVANKLRAFATACKRNPEILFAICPPDADVPRQYWQHAANAMASHLAAKAREIDRYVTIVTNAADAAEGE